MLLLQVHRLIVNRDPKFTNFVEVSCSLLGFIRFNILGNELLVKDCTLIQGSDLGFQVRSALLSLSGLIQSLLEFTAGASFVIFHVSLAVSYTQGYLQTLCRFIFLHVC